MLVTQPISSLNFYVYYRARYDAGAGGVWLEISPDGMAWSKPATASKITLAGEPEAIIVHSNIGEYLFVQITLAGITTLYYTNDRGVTWHSFYNAFRVTYSSLDGGIWLEMTIDSATWTKPIGATVIATATAPSALNVVFDITTATVVVTYTESGVVHTTYTYTLGVTWLT